METMDPLPGNVCPHKFYVSRELIHKVLCAGFVQGSRVPNPTPRLNQSLILGYFDCLWRTAEEWTEKVTCLKNVNNLCKQTFSLQFLCSLQKSKLLFQPSTPSSEEKAYPFIPTPPFPHPLTIHTTHLDYSATLELAPLQPPTPPVPATPSAYPLLHHSGSSRLVRCLGGTQMPRPHPNRTEFPGGVEHSHVNAEEAPWALLPPTSKLPLKPDQGPNSARSFSPETTWTKSPAHGPPSCTF